MIKNLVNKLAVRFRYPVSLPEDVASSLGIQLPNHLTFEDFINTIENEYPATSRLTRFMPREQAELAFKSAVRKEHFKDTTLCSFFFNNGWMEFTLKFDSESRLRRIYVQHKDITEDKGIELKLQSL